QFLEETIRSTLLQGYPNLEYIIIDGNSTDGSVEIIEKYAPWLTHWVSEPDRGQAHAINKGFTRCTGDLLGWINSDDALLPNALQNLALAHQKAPEAILLGDVMNIDNDNDYSWLESPRNVSFENIVQPWRHSIFWQQPGIYFTRALYETVGKLDETLRYVFDWDWMCRALQTAPVHYLHVPVAQFRYHSTSKTVGEAADWSAEEHIVTKRYQNKSNDTNAKLAQAAWEIHLADTYLRLHNWARTEGLSHLRMAVECDWRVLKWRKFWLLCLKGLLPFKLLQMLRVAYLQRFKKYLFG
ncbi:MAG: glycosyltransferase, partial [Chloroflexi bacterium]|nr:glycosyltransferase [Chloroflexota bacterium]